MSLCQPVRRVVAVVYPGYGAVLHMVVPGVMVHGGVGRSMVAPRGTGPGPFTTTDSFVFKGLDCFSLIFQKMTKFTKFPEND